MWVSGWLAACLACGTSHPPRVTKELWDAHDRVVVGCATCAKCGQRQLFTRRLTPAEAKAPQAQGQPIQVAVLARKAARR